MSKSPEVYDPADPRAQSACELAGWLEFQWHLALAPVEGAALLNEHGGCPRRALAAAAYRRERPWNADAGLAPLRASGAVALPLTSPANPARLAQLRDPALLLLVRGDVAALSAPSVAIVGSRAATAYGRRVATRLGRELARAGLVVVSGLALGIDGAAHHGALEAGGRTVAVMATGPDRIYPVAHRGLAAAIARRGALVSELPPGTPPLPSFFPLRNRMISALASAVVVVEARERSGSLITAGHAANQGVDVFAVPGPVDAPTSRGTNRLLREGAAPAIDSTDILGALGIPIPGDTAAAPIGAPESAGQRAILSALVDAPATQDELVGRLRRPPEQLSLELLELELAGRAVRDRDGRWRPA